jgi:stage V sporulation protein B
MAADPRRFVQDVGLSFASLAISSLVHFLLRIFLARYLGPADLGQYTLAYTFYSFGVLLSAFGIGGGVGKYVAENKEDALALPTMRKGRLLLVGVVSSFVIGCMMWLILHFSSPWIAERFFRMPDLSSLLQIVALAFPFIALEKATLGFLNGMRRMGLYAFVNVAQNVLILALTVALALLGYGLEGAVVALVVPIVLLSLFSVVALQRQMNRPTRAQSARIFRILLRFGVFVVMGNGMYMLFYNVDKILLGRFIDDVAVGIYGTAAILSGLVTLIPSALQLVTGPTIASYWGRGESDNIRTLVNRTMKYAAMLILPLSLAGILLSRDLITLIFGEDYVSATVPLQILLAAFGFGGIFTSVGTALAMTRWVHMGFVLGAAQVVANLVLGIVLIPHLGMSGAAVATAASLAFGALLSLYFMQRFIKIAIDRSWFARFLFVSALVFAGSFALGLVVNQYLGGALGLAVLVFIILRYFVTDEDREVIRRVVSLRRPAS